MQLHTTCAFYNPPQHVIGPPFQASHSLFHTCCGDINFFSFSATSSLLFTSPSFNNKISLLPRHVPAPCCVSIAEASSVHHRVVEPGIFVMDFSTVAVFEFHLAGETAPRLPPVVACAWSLAFLLLPLCPVQFSVYIPSTHCTRCHRKFCHGDNFKSLKSLCFLRKFCLYQETLSRTHKACIWCVKCLHV